MTRRTALIGAAMLVLSAGAAWAHEGHAHTIKGTVMAIHEKAVDVKTPSGETLSIAIDAKTAVLEAKKKIDRADIRVGRRVVVDIGDGKDPLTARKIELGAAPTVAAKK